MSRATQEICWHIRNPDLTEKPLKTLCGRSTYKTMCVKDPVILAKAKILGRWLSCKSCRKAAWKADLDGLQGWLLLPYIKVWESRFGTNPEDLEVRRALIHTAGEAYMA